MSVNDLANAKRLTGGDPDDQQLAIALALIDIAESLQAINARAAQLTGIQ